MENLKNKCESSDEAKGEDAFYSREAEITELESLIPEIEEKIQDTKDMKEEADKAGKTENGTTGFDKSKLYRFITNPEVGFLKQKVIPYCRLQVHIYFQSLVNCLFLL